MSETGAAQYDVLHIRPGSLEGSRSAPDAAAIEQALRNPALAVEIATNVYEGLAMLADPGASKPKAVVVSIEGLSRTEMEFFGLAPRACRGLPVYVYGTGQDDLRVGEALGFGASSWATPELIESLAGKEPPAEASEADGPASTEVRPIEPINEAAESWEPVDRHEPPEEDLHEEDDDEPEDETEEESAVRVPWLRYPDRPSRAAPPRTPPQESRPQPPHEKPAPPAHTPLLTDEELQALIGDDIASLAPHRTGDQAHDDIDDQERSR